MKLKPWLRFFRLPNLPTAPGDAWAGAAFFLPDAAERLPQALTAGVCALLVYMFGLADNDLAGAETDGPERPVPAGDISPRAARVARGLLFAGAWALGIAGGLGRGWACATGALVLSILVYNRRKGNWLMGLCRGLSVVAGALAVRIPGAEPAGWAMLAFLALGWTAYIAAVTRLSEGEDRASEGLGHVRYGWGLAAFVPCGACFFLPDPAQAVLPLAGSLFTYLSWCVAVSCLGAPHSSELRRRAVGATIGGLLYMQVGYMLVGPRAELIAAALAVWVAARLARRLAPSISGS
ncbi:MAG: UbiA family prenyltransferase [Kiritimatiellia bacterium]